MLPLVLLLALLTGRAMADGDGNAFVVVISDAPPFRVIEQWDGAGEYSGVFIDALSELSDRTGLKLTLKGLSYSQALAMMADGSADMMLGVKWTAQQTLFLDYLNTWFPAEPNVFFLGDGQKDLWTYDDLSGLRIGLLRGSRPFNRLDDDGTLTKTWFDSYSKAFRALYDGAMDVVLAPRRQGRYTMKQLGMEFKTANYHDPGEPTFIAISKKSGLAEKRLILEKHLSEMRRERYFQRLLEIYDF